MTYLTIEQKKVKKIKVIDVKFTNEKDGNA